jgi:hypothetical protein
MAVPPEVVKRIGAWCDARTPPDLRDRCRLEHEVVGNKITIHECTVMPGEGDWLRVPSAQLRFDDRTRVWALYWMASDDRWHIVQATPTLDVDELLAEIERDPDFLFFG